MMEIDAKNIHYKELNKRIREAVNNGEKEIHLKNINGHRYIADNLGADVKIFIDGVPGNDLGFSMAGPQIYVDGNGQDAVGNTMGHGKIVINGNAGDICGYAMRGGKIFIKGNVGYRSGIHMKEYKGDYPVIVIGGYAGDFFGEYMAGGVLVVLGLEKEGRDIVGKYCGTGMHGGRIYMRGKIPEWHYGKEVMIKELDSDDEALLKDLLAEYNKDLNMNLEFDMSEFIKLYPGSTRPYGRLYAY
ncbi:MAG: hypothetical protein ACTSVI_09685 [Promethearchaeota archaeon]